MCECKQCHKKIVTLYKDGLCYNCWEHNRSIDNTEVDNNSKSKYHNDIVLLREKGLSYNEIARILGCSKSTISYCLSKKTREKTKERVENWKENNEWQCKLIKAIDTFKNRKINLNKVSYCKNWRKKLGNAIIQFKSRGMGIVNDFTYKDVIERFNGTTVTCELTGRTIDITKDDYNIDHILPVARDGTNELDNLAFTIPSANLAKNSLTNEEFVELCKEVCEHFGYTVIKN